ncbi:MAG: hypothetical protein WCH76_08250, partial [Candidatus Riflemargulisbacteria bacterium]
LKVDCSNCKQCCNFYFFSGEVMTFDELRKNFFYTENLCNTFFDKTEENYYIGQACRQIKKGKCSIYDSDHFPFTCAFYPLFLTGTSFDNAQLYIDKNCPQWKNILNQIKEDKNITDIIPI